MYLNHQRNVSTLVSIAVLALIAASCGTSDNGGSNDECPEGFVNLDERIDGCECEITDANDPIDENGLDENCDGVDGILEDSVFVSPRGTEDFHIGDSTSRVGLSPEMPVRSLQTAIELAKARERHTILVAGGTYEGAITIEDGISIHGGYNVYFSAREPEFEVSTIEATAEDFPSDTLRYITVAADDIQQETTLSHLTIQGLDAINPSGSTLAIHAVNSGGLSLQHLDVIAGDASPGADGEDGAPIASDCTAASGGTGGRASDLIYPCDREGMANLDAEPGSSGYPGNNNARAGERGAAGLGGVARCGLDYNSADDGEDGDPGTNGEPGAHGHYPIDNDIGYFSTPETGGLWHSAHPTEPEDGGDGGGGGGAGAGGNFQSDVRGTLYVGTAGTDGGAGGCGGTAGSNGEPGGSSFGLSIIGQPLALDAIHIVMGNGGGGGKGGAGQSGTPGEVPDTPDTVASGGGRGGEGGLGGRGGDGGHGAGGNAGHSVGLALSAVQQDSTGVTFDYDGVVRALPGIAKRPDPDDPFTGLVEEIHEF